MVFEIIGWVGTGCILLAYLLVSTSKTSPKSLTYQLLNAFGAIGIIVNSLVHHALPSVGLNVMWLVIAAYGLVNALKSKR